ncbi:unknown protein [Seminavis robusta]|uniref:Macro domain-containing protein n=1 Tax=Seminavis robusta TaxID=568900 RepID=A0A9N8DD39_9STRA|nr:unknown protein [Seminavis robusta]|eukprot:Sro35_g022380.1 n/a (104) ;mRNA; r:83224-83535
MIGPGPNNPYRHYKNLKAPYVIHACGPDFGDCDIAETVAKAKKHLRNAYRNALHLTINKPISDIIFPLISSGVFRGPLFLSEIAGIAVRAVHDRAAESKVASI